MAGGDRTSDHGTMADRVARTRLHGSTEGLRKPPGPDPMAVVTPRPPADPLAGETATYADTTSEAGAQHVLVATTRGRVPGLLVQWRRHVSGEWEALVVHHEQLRGRATVVRAWVPARWVEPVKPEDSDQRDEGQPPVAT